MLSVDDLLSVDPVPEVLVSEVVVSVLVPYLALLRGHFPLLLKPPA